MTGVQVWTRVPSPFCGIASDDLVVRVEGEQVKILENGDAVTVAGFEHPLGDRRPRVQGRSATLEEAVAAAAECLRQARRPVFGGFGTDVEGARAALSLAERCGATVDQARAGGGLRNLLTLSDTGWTACTLAELKNRAEVLIVFGGAVETDFPRFYERFVWNRDTLFDLDTSRRDIVYIGGAPVGDAACAPDGRKPQALSCAPEHWPAVAAALNALAKGANLQAGTVGGIAVGDLRAVVERMKKARYSVVTWAAGQLNYPHAELTVQQLCQAVVALNRSGETRAAVLPLGGQDGDRTASQVFAWQTGYPTRIGYMRGYPEYDPYHYAATALLDSGEADALLWVADINARQTPPPTAAPTIVVGRCGMSFEREPDVFVPVGVPGIDHAGHTYRCDSVVCLPLRKLRDVGLPSAAEVMAAIERALG